MKKSTLSAIIVVIIIVVGVIWYTHSGSNGSGAAMPQGSSNTVPTGTTPAISPTETTKVSGNMSQYENDELGFSVKYPNTWEADQSNAGVTFVVPIDKTQVSTIATLQGNIQITPGTCAFPPVTTIKDRGTLTVGANTLNMISMSTTVQGRDYFDRMYSLQHGSVCYIFHFASISQPTSKLSGSQVAQAQNNNKAIVNDTDTAFTNVVKTFTFVTLPAGVDETKAAPAKK